MSKYTSPIFRRKEAYLSNIVPAYKEIGAVQRFASSHLRLWKSMVNKLGSLVSDDAIRKLEDNVWFSATTTPF